MKSTGIGFALAAASLCSMPGHAAEKRIAKADLPPAVAKTAAEVSQGAVVKAFVLDNENGQTAYEVEMTVDGHSKDVAIGINGEVLEVEEQVAMNGLPTEVRSGLQTKAGSGSITKVESITKRGKLVAYEAQVRTGAKHSEVQVGSDGKLLDHEE